MPACPQTFIVVDCNDFFASCEKVFAPQLRGKPVVVLSNNDGCVVARSIEAKILGVPMGAPLFQVKELLEQHKVTIFSSNFALYGDFSARISGIVRDWIPDVELYSIDEVFADISHIKIENQTKFCQDLRARIYAATGITVSIGIAPTKTLSKLMNDVAKQKNKRLVRAYWQQWGRFPSGRLSWWRDIGVESWCGIQDKQQAMESLEVGDIWGVGRRNGEKCRLMGVKTVWDFVRADESVIQKLFTIVGAKTQRELQGESCFALDPELVGRKSIMSTRSFGVPVTDVTQMCEAISSYTAKLAAKLRKQGSSTPLLTVYFTTKKHATRYLTRSLTINLDEPTNATTLLCAEAVRAVREIFVPGYRYKKAGVFATGLVKDGDVRENLFMTEATRKLRQKHEAAAHVSDIISKKYGLDTLQLLGEGICKKWLAKSNQRSARYTTSWAEIRKIV